MDRPQWRKALLATASGVLTALTMPGFGFVPLAFVSLVPLFFALEGAKRLRWALLFGAVFIALDMRWMLTLTRFSPWVVPGFALLAVYLGIFTGLFALFLRRTAGPERGFGPLLLLSAPCGFALLEFARAQGPIGTGFSALYQSLYRAPALIQGASVFGPWAITAGVVFVNAALYLAIRRRRLGYLLAAGVGVATLAAFLLIPIAEDGEDALRVAVVSSNVRQETKLDARNLPELTDRYERLGLRAVSEDPDLVVFPESILPAYILSNEEVFSRLRGLAVEGEARILFGTGVYRNREILNKVALLSETGELVGTYAMVRPVPFGETIPWRGLWEAIGLGSFVDSFLPLDLTPGDAFEPLAEFGTPICFESTFPEPSRRLTQAGASLLATVTNDAWFVGSSELPAHFAAAVFRAVETRRYVIQSANGGISGLVDPRGRILAQTRSEGVTVSTAAMRNDRSLYVRWGDLPFLILVGLGCAVSIGVRVRDRMQSGG